MRAYVDTNIFMDFLCERDSVAYEFFVKVLSCLYTVVISDVVLRELSFQEVDTENMFRLISHKLVIIKANDKDKIKAKTLPTHYNDALHICIAEREADLIVTKNIKDFSCSAIPVYKAGDDF